MRRVKPVPGMVLVESVEFEPGIYSFPDGEGIQVAASGITIQGHETVLLGPGNQGVLDSFKGVAISATGHDDVTVEGVIVRGFQLAMKVADGKGWTIQNNDFSYNYSDEEYGWGEGFPYGAVLLIRVDHSIIRGNTALSNWNGLSLRESNGNEIRNNQFSHCTNVCLKLWNSSDNLIEDNTFSYGLRIQPGETHARDSTSALIESGSNNNRFLRNDFTHGGDGVFIRPLNGWHSEDNYFEGNDASFAHNNAWECWSPNNTFVRNKGNYSSYGFWMGGSDGTVMVGNEAAYNGTLHQNAPESDFGHAGIAVVHGSSSHFRLVGNVAHHNSGPGLALGFKPEYPALHWVITGNWFQYNRFGMYFRHASDLYLGENVLTQNVEREVLEGPGLSRIKWLSAKSTATTAGIDGVASSPRVRVSGHSKRIGSRSYVVSLGHDLITELQLPEAWSAETANVEWVGASGEINSGTNCTWCFGEAGYYRLSVTAYDATSVNLDWVNVYVVDDRRAEIGTEGPLDTWSVASSDIAASLQDIDIVLDDRVCLAGESSVKVSTAEPSFTARTVCDETWGDNKCLQGWLRIRHHAVFGLRGTKARVRIGQSNEDYVEYEHQGHWFEGFSYNEGWQDWYYISIPFRGDETWKRTQVGLGCQQAAHYIEFLHEGGDEEEALVEIWIDGLQVADAP